MVREPERVTRHAVEAAIVVHGDKSVVGTEGRRHLLVVDLEAEVATTTVHAHGQAVTRERLTVKRGRVGSVIKRPIVQA